MQRLRGETRVGGGSAQLPGELHLTETFTLSEIRRLALRARSLLDKRLAMAPNALIAQPTCLLANAEMRDQNGRSGSKSSGPRSGTS